MQNGMNEPRPPIAAAVNGAQENGRYPFSSFRVVFFNLLGVEMPYKVVHCRQACARGPTIRRPPRIPNKRQRPKFLNLCKHIGEGGRPHDSHGKTYQWSLVSSIYARSNRASDSQCCREQWEFAAWATQATYFSSSFSRPPSYSRSR